jgi:hypothetical protein
MVRFGTLMVQKKDFKKSLGNLSAECLLTFLPGNHFNKTKLSLGL